MVIMCYSTATISIPTVPTKHSPNFWEILNPFKVLSSEFKVISALLVQVHITMLYLELLRWDSGILSEMKIEKTLVGNVVAEATVLAQCLFRVKHFCQELERMLIPAKSSNQTRVHLNLRSLFLGTVCRNKQ